MSRDSPAATCDRGVKATEAIPIKLSIPIQTLHVQATHLERKRLLRAEGLARCEDRPVSEVCAAIDELIPLLAPAAQESVDLFFVVVAAVEEPAPVGIAERHGECRVLIQAHEDFAVRGDRTD